MSRRFSLARVWAILLKEFLQMRRDRVTLGMIVGVPLMQLFLFGFAINFNPKALPTAVSVDDTGTFARSIVAALRNSSYFDIVTETNSPAGARRLLQEGKVLFVVEIPVNFTRDIMRGTRPDLLIEADATDPAASGFAMGAFTGLAATALRDDLKGPLASRAQGPPPFNAVTHLLYNTESNTRYSIIPGLLAIILTMTMVLMTCLALTRERERGTFENLLATPVTPLEVMAGKIVPYILVGFVQAAIILVAARFLFDVPMLGATRSGSQVGLQVILYAWATVACSLLLIPVAPMGLVYSVSALVFGGWFIYESHRLYSRAVRGGEPRPMRVFHASITYLTLLFVAIAVDPLLPF